MTTEASSATVKRISVSGILVEVVRKDIKNLHLGVYPPLGRVRVAAPLVINDEAVRLAVIDKLGWIKRQRAQFASQPRQSEREMVNGESHYFWGRRYRLRVHEQSGPPRVALRGIASIDLFVRPGSTALARQNTLQTWYRAALRAAIADLLAQWQPQLGVQVAGWGIKKMKTKWGSCNAPVQCLEYIVVHELVHLIERHHNERFTALMDQHMPDWPQRRQLLNGAPLGHEHWSY